MLRLEDQEIKFIKNHLKNGCKKTILHEGRERIMYLASNLLNLFKFHYTNQKGEGSWRFAALCYETEDGDKIVGFDFEKGEVRAFFKNRMHLIHQLENWLAQGKLINVVIKPVDIFAMEFNTFDLVNKETDSTQESIWNGVDITSVLSKDQKVNLTTKYAINLKDKAIENSVKTIAQMKGIVFENKNQGGVVVLDDDMVEFLNEPRFITVKQFLQTVL